jgi:sugar transferase (PEP-CTERM/EpsH1 system associated)
VATLAHSQEEVEQGSHLAHHCSEVLAEVVPSPMRWIRAAGSLPTAVPSSARYFWSGSLYRRIEDLQTRMNLDAVVVHCAFVAGYVKGVRAHFRLLDFGDLDSRKWHDYAKYRPFPWSAGYALEAFKLGRLERELASEFDHCTVTAPGEFESYEEMGSSTPCSVIPNGVDVEYFQLSRNRSSQSAVIVFLGRMDYFPNVAGILDFVENVFPLVRRQIPEASLRIVGSNPSPEVRALSQLPQISVTGFVHDVRPLVEDAAVAIAPMKIARGTQNKVLECMAMGIPVVASPQAARGVQAVPGIDLLVGDTARQFAGHVVNIIRNPGLRSSISEAARRRVVTAHRWDASMRLLDEVLADGCERACRPGMEAGANVSP